MKKLVLLRLIELKRIELHMIAKTFGLLSKETIRCSEELDHLLNTFQNKQASCFTSSNSEIIV